MSDLRSQYEVFVLVMRRVGDAKPERIGKAVFAGAFRDETTARLEQDRLARSGSLQASRAAVDSPIESDRRRLEDEVREANQGMLLGLIGADDDIR